MVNSNESAEGTLISLSSTATAIYRTGLPLAFLVAATGSAAAAIVTGDAILVIAAVASLLAGGLTYRLFRQLRHIVADGDTLYIEQDKSMVPVPLSAVDDIEARSGTRPPIGYVYFKSPTA